MKLKEIDKASRHPITVRLPPPGRARYALDLPTNSELIISALTQNTEICAGRISPNQFRIWTRERKVKK